MWMALLAVLFTCGIVHADGMESGAPAVFSDGIERLNLTPTMQWLQDPTREMTLEQARAKFDAAEHSPYGGDFFQLGPSRTAVWLRLNIENQTDRDAFVLEILNPRLPEIDVYYPDQHGGFTESRLGIARPYAERDVRFPYPATTVRMEPWATSSIYLRVYNTGDMRFLVRLWETNGFLNHAANAFVTEYLMAGLLLAMVVFHLVIYFSLREINYLLLSLFLAAWLLWYLAFTATGSVLLWPDWPLLAERSPTVTTLMVCATFAIFGNSLLEVRKFARRWSNALMLYAAICGLGILEALLFDNIWRIYIAITMVALGPVITIAASIRVAGRGGASARRFLLTWCCLHLGGVTIIVISSYLFTSRGFGASWINLVVVLSTLLWTFDLTGRVKLRMRAQRQLLEEKVEERTKELRTALSEVKTLSGLLPMCAGCKKVRDDSGYWSSVESFIKEHSNADFTHGLCPDCRASLYPEVPMKSAQAPKSRGEKA
ncbi:MAG: hypothetical protein GC168_11600 [Candidatus Hydrogenedens sp.]|nr:hypothetical protein [Candidatus Hydrogenedens sp.]